MNGSSGRKKNSPPSPQYRQLVTNHSDSEDDHGSPNYKGLHTKTKVGSGSGCLLPCLLILLILFSLSLGITFFLMAPQRAPSSHLSDILSYLGGGRTSTTVAPLTSTPSPRSTSTPRATTTPIVSNNGTEMGGGNATLLDGTIEGVNGTEVIIGVFNSSDESAHFKEDLLKFIRKSEHFMETFTGVEGELLVPLFMLLCLVSSLGCVSICCCLLNARKEARRRLILGKIITDLETGDSERVLLNTGHTDH